MKIWPWDFFYDCAISGATVYLNETNIVVQEGDDGNTTVDICIVLADDMGGLQRNIVVDLTVMPDSKYWYEIRKMVQAIVFSLHQLFVDYKWATGDEDLCCTHTILNLL